jgi:hypothetical protein
VSQYSSANFRDSDISLYIEILENCLLINYSLESFNLLQFQYANFSSPDYVKTGSGFLTFRLIKQRADFAFGFFSGDLTDVSSFTPIHKLQLQPFFFETGLQLSGYYKSKIVITLLLHLGI